MFFQVSGLGELQIAPNELADHGTPTAALVSGQVIERFDIPVVKVNADTLGHGPTPRYYENPLENNRKYQKLSIGHAPIATSGLRFPLGAGGVHFHPAVDEKDGRPDPEGPRGLVIE
jgi:hypothetical protein